MPIASQEIHRGIVQFFLIALAHESLYNFYRMNFALMQYHKYSLADIEGMMPWEKEIYVSLLLQYLEEEKSRQKTSTAYHDD